MSKLYVVATPIGNLKDLTFRALEILRQVDLILTEDTRISRKLLDHYQIKKKTVAYYQHSGQSRLNFILDFLKNNREVALITDAGTPGLSDPGNQLIASIVKNLGEQCAIIPLPGPSALTAALSVAGLPTDRFVFLGFLPHKKGKEKVFKKINDSEELIIFYESTHRILKTLKRLADLLDGNRPVVVCRELTKKFERIYRGSVSEVIEQLMADSTKGEFVVMIGR